MAERKRPRRTRERILETSLALFNRLGEPHVTTADIAGEMGISPGNLYYHFRNKEEIVGELFGAYEASVRPLLASPTGHAADVEDLWLLLHLLLERMQAYRFLYRDLVDIAGRQRRVAGGMASLLRDGEATLHGVFEGLGSAGHLDATAGEMDALARNAMLVVTHSAAYERLRANRNQDEEPDPGRAAYQVLTLIAPHLAGDARRLVARISQDYLAHRTPP